MKQFNSLTQKIPNFRSDLDDSEEDTLSDEELGQDIKMDKLEDLTLRADYVCEQTAIQQIV